MSKLHANLTQRILIGMGIGVVVGLLINAMGSDAGFGAGAVLTLDTIGQIFVKLLKMLVVPLVFVSLICGAASLADPRRLIGLGGKTISLYLATTALAITLAITVASIVQPGAGAQFEPVEYVAKEAPGVQQVILDLVPQNPIQAMAEGKMLQVIVFAILLGVAITLAGESGKRIKQFMEDANDVIMQLVMLVMWVAPFGVFALIAKLFATIGWAAFQPVLGYFFTVFFVLIAHGLVTYPTLVVTLARMHPLMFLNKMRAAWAFAFSTSSSNATIPVTLRTTEERMGVDNSVAAFTIPLGATINMDGTAIMQGVATVFIANAYGIDLTLVQLATVVGMAMLASIGTAGVPSVGLIMLAMVLQQVGLPVEGIALIIGVDRILDMTRTCVNITGDVAVTCIVARSEGEFDSAVFNDPAAGVLEEPAV